MDGAVDLACFSYLAGARLLAVDRYPAADTGAEVHSVTHSLAGDGPITAITARGLGLRTALAANHVGSDVTGSALLSRLDGAGVQHQLSLQAATMTAELTIITDRTGTRTWFAYLAPAYAGLADVDLSALTTARLTYIDCYAVLTAAATRAITATARAGVPLMLNLGGDPLHPDIAQAAAGSRPIVQTSLPENQAHHAGDLADDLARRLAPDVVLVTLGSLGAIAHQVGARHRAPAGDGPIIHTHGAGAAFSAGFAAAHLNGHDTSTALRQACLIGTAHCGPPGSHPGRSGTPPSPTGVPACP
ncbi:carbohydrate kinase family protein [Sphaerisporangium album]|uniref:Carbohydrate kinase family protein n=1 Tax=Sphaerisporangium album TaxID=509200 RepID=A0A367EN27_9ACTN|nr:PfkB family carbohydrate kinase [Sphaerisporangium album]RCG19102.1 carbohydrate kinase family protein [Sphaerisporangium album]